MIPPHAAWIEAIRNFIGASWPYPEKDHEYGCPIERVGMNPVFRRNMDGSTTFVCRQDQMRRLALSTLWRYLTRGRWTSSAQGSNANIVMRGKVWYFQDHDGIRHRIEPGLTFTPAGFILEKPEDADLDQAYKIISETTHSFLLNQHLLKPNLSKKDRQRAADISERGQSLLADIDAIKNGTAFNAQSLPEIGMWSTPHGDIRVLGEIFILNQPRTIALEYPHQTPALRAIELYQFWENVHSQSWKHEPEN